MKNISPSPGMVSIAMPVLVLLIMMWLIAVPVAGAATGPWSLVPSGRRQRLPLTQAQQAKERDRLSRLSPHRRERERVYLERSIADLYQLQDRLKRNISQLEYLRDMNTGAANSWSERYKATAREYGMPLLAWYGAVWTTTALFCYGTISIFQIDTLRVLRSVDAQTGWSLSRKINPTMGKIGMAFIANELLEPIRLPTVLVTIKPVVDKLRSIKSGAFGKK
jgi:Protein of unknown function (DUF1279)